MFPALDDEDERENEGRERFRDISMVWTKDVGIGMMCLLKREREREKEKRSAHKDEEDEQGVVQRALPREEGDAEVNEDEVLREEGEELEDVFGGVLGLDREVVKGVVGHEDAAEEHRHDTGGMHTLGKEVRGVGKHNEGANREGAKEDPNKVAETKEDA